MSVFVYYCIMKGLYLVSVYLHILCASLWVGGMLFLVLVLLPAIKNHPERRLLLNNVGVKFRFVGWIALVLLLLTGLYNMHYRGVSFGSLFNSPYNKLFAIKLILFTIVLIISAFHDFYIGPRSIKLMENSDNKDKDAKKYVKTARIVGELNLLLALIAVALGVIIVRGW